MLQRMKIGSKLAMGFGLCLVLTIGMAILASSKMASLGDVQGRGAKRAENAIAAQDTAAAALRVYRVTADAVINRDLTASAAAWSRVKDETSSALASLASMADTEEEKQWAAAAKAHFGSAVQVYEQRLLPALSAGDGVTQKIRYLDGQLDTHVTAMVEECRAFADSLTKESAEADRTFEGVQAGTARMLLLMGILAVFAALVPAVYLGLSIVGPIRAVDAQLREIADGGGDLTHEITVSSRDEMGTLAGNFNRFLSFLRGLLREIAEAAGQVSASSTEMAAAGDQSSRATEQISQTITQVAIGSGKQSEQVATAAGSLHELVEGMEMLATGTQDQAASSTEAAQLMNNLVQHIETIVTGSAEQVRVVGLTAARVSRTGEAVKRAGNAVDAVAMARAASEQAIANGEQAVDRTVDGMQRIEVTTAQAADRVRALGERSQQIGEIVAVIDDIAEQTNLLALNAAIEAARAGEHGKGFAVVADEVRKLAERSGKATKEIASLIAGIRVGVTQSVDAMQEGRQEVGRGVAVVGETRAALAVIRDAEGATHARVEEIAAVLSEVDALSQDMDTTMPQISRISEGNAQTAEQMAAASQKAVRSVESIAAVTQQASAAVAEMAAGTNEMTAAVESVAAISQQNAAAAQEVSAASEEQTAGVQQIAAHAQQLADIASRLQEAVNHFRIDEAGSRGGSQRRPPAESQPQATLRYKRVA